MTKLGNLLEFGQLFKVLGNNSFGDFLLVPLAYKQFVLLPITEIGALE